MPRLEQLESRLALSTLVLAMKADEPERPETLLGDDSVVTIPIGLRIIEDHHLLTFSYSHDADDFTIDIVPDHGSATPITATTVQLPLEATQVRIIVHGEEHSEVTLSLAEPASATLLIGHRQLAIHLGRERSERPELPERPELRERPEGAEVAEVPERPERAEQPEEYAMYHQLYEDTLHAQELLDEAHWDKPPTNEQRSSLLLEVVRERELPEKTVLLLAERPAPSVPAPVRMSTSVAAPQMAAPATESLGMASLGLMLLSLATVEPEHRTTTHWLFCA